MRNVAPARLPPTQIILEMSVFLMHDDFVHRNALLVARFNFPIVLAKHHRPQSRQGKVEQVAEERKEENFD